MWKVFDAQSWSALLSLLGRMKKTADDNSSAVSGLGEDLVEYASETTKALQGMDTNKANKSSSVAITIPAAGWAQDGTAEYPYYLDVPVEGVTARDRADVTIVVSGLSAARACGLCPVSETSGGKIRFRAKVAPTADIEAEYWIMEGKE